MSCDVYADVMFLSNLTVDLFALAVSAIAIKKKARLFRLLLSACFGAAFATVFFFLDFLPLYVVIPADAAALFIMILIAFGFGSVKKLICRSVLFAITLFGFSALILALALLTPLGSRIIFSGGFYFFDISFFTVLLSSFLGAALCFIVLAKKRPDAEERAVYDARLTVFGKTVRCKALLDTGNSLTDGIYGIPVLVCAYGAIKEALPLELKNEDIYKSPDSLYALPPDAAKRLRTVFVKTVSGSALILAFTVDTLELSGVGIVKRETAVAVSPEPLGKYPLLLNPAIFD